MVEIGIVCAERGPGATRLGRSDSEETIAVENHEKKD